MPHSEDPPALGNGGQEQNPGIRRSEHARLRFRQQRPVQQVVNDIQVATAKDVYIDVEEQRFVVRGPRSREHIIELSGEHLTSLRRPQAAHQARLQSGAIRPATEAEFQELKEFVA